MSKRFKLPKDVHSSDVFGDLPEEVALEAIGLWAVAGSYARRHDTGGHVPERAIKMWDPSVAAIEALNNRGIWTNDPSFPGHRSYCLANWED